MLRRLKGKKAKGEGKEGDGAGESPKPRTRQSPNAGRGAADSGGADDGKKKRGRRRRSSQQESQDDAASGTPRSRGVSTRERIAQKQSSRRGASSRTLRSEDQSDAGAGRRRDFGSRKSSLRASFDTDRQVRSGGISPGALRALSTRKLEGVLEEGSEPPQDGAARSDGPSKTVHDVVNEEAGRLAGAGSGSDDSVDENELKQELTELFRLPGEATDRRGHRSEMPILRAVEYHTLVAPLLPGELLPEDLHVAIERAVGPHVVYCTVRPVRPAKRGATVAIRMTRGTAGAERQTALIHLDSADAKTKLLAAPLHLFGETVHLSESTVPADAFDSAKAYRAARATRRQKQAEDQLAVQIAEQEDMYGPNPLELRTVAARRLLAVPGVHHAALGQRTAESLAARKERRRMRRIEREREKDRTKEEMRKRFEELYVYEGRRAALTFAAEYNAAHDSEEEILQGDSEDEERERATQAFVAVPKSAVAGEAQEVETELFDAVGDNDPIRVEALLKELRHVRKDVLQSKRNDARLQAIVAERGRKERQGVGATGARGAADAIASDPFVRTLQYLTTGAACATLLHAAAQHGSLDCLGTLLREGVDIESRDRDMNTPLHYAVMARRVETAEMLLLRGARVQAHGVSGFSALHMAAGTGSVDMCRLLLHHGAVVVDKSEDGSTPVALAMREGRVDVQTLLSNHMKRYADRKRQERLERKLGWMYEDEEAEVEEEAARGRR